MLLLLSTAFVSGCSSSGSQQSLEDVDTTGDTDFGAVDATGLDVENVPSTQNSANTITEIDAQDPLVSDSDGRDETPSDAGENGRSDSTDSPIPSDEIRSPDESLPEPESNLPGSEPAQPFDDGNQPDPMSPASVVVDFDITVPAYMSNELRLEMVWGDTELQTQWVGDELWIASASFPSDTTAKLVITFYDKNGAIALGDFEVAFQTGNNENQNFKVTADQFDTERWDRDLDGVSNLNELITGTDPLMAETQLEIVEDYFDDGWQPVLADVGGIENLLSDLPYFEDTDEFTADEDGGSYSVDRTIEFDENGSGSFVVATRDREPFDGSTSIDINAIRSNTGNSITYNLTRNRYNSSAARRDERGIISDTHALGANTRTQTAQLSRWESGTGSDYREKTNYTLTGLIITDTKTCEASYGVLTYEHTRVRVDGDIVLTTVSKAIDDQYWNVTTTKPDGSVVNEYLAQRLGNVFYCDMVGL